MSARFHEAADPERLPCVPQFAGLLYARAWSAAYCPASDMATRVHSWTLTFSGHLGYPFVPDSGAQRKLIELAAGRPFGLNRLAGDRGSSLRAVASAA